MFTPFAFVKQDFSLPSGYTFYVDASISDSYPGTGTTWFDLSGNNYNLTLNSSSVFQNDGGNDKYMDFSNGIAKYLPGGTLTNIPTTNSAIGTWVFYTSVKNTTPLPGDTWKTLLRGTGGVHAVIINQADGISLGNFIEPAFRDSGFDMTTIPNVVTEPHMMAWKLVLNTTPRWSFFYDSFTSAAQATTDTSPGANTWASACIGAWHSDSSSPTVFSQNWGKVWFAAFYPFELSTAQLDQVNVYIAKRYN
jgi:hypothetical protein